MTNANITAPRQATSNESLSSPITGQFRSSPFYVALGAPLLASLLSIGLTTLTYRVLPENVARDLMAQINPMLLISGGGGGIGGALGMVKRGLDITQGKIRVQAPPQMPENLTIGTAVNNAAPVADPPMQSVALGAERESTSTPGVPFPEDGDFSDFNAFDMQARAVLEQEAQNGER